MLSRWPADPQPVQKRDDGRRASGQLAQHFAITVADWDRAGKPCSCEVLHQAEKEGKILYRDPLFIQRENMRTGFGADEVVGVLDALGDTLERQGFPKVISGDELVQVIVGDFRIDRHASWTRAIRVGA